MSVDHSSSPPSSPLSVLSKSPSLPSSPILPDPAKRYPSPTASSQSGGASPMKSPARSDEISVSCDGPPPTKRRRVNPRKPRTTQYINLEDRSEKDEEHLEGLLKALHKKKKVVVIAGAGISVSAGIPDFRSQTGLFTTLRGQHGIKGSGKHLFDASVYKHDASTTSFHTMVRELGHLTQNAKPTPFHHLLASLAHEKRLMRLYSQNVDCIDTSMAPLATNVPLNVKGPWPTTIQLHGSLEHMVCSKCGQLEPFDGSLFEGPEAPTCKTCVEADEVRTAFAGKRSHGVGRLRPRMVLYNEYNPDDEAIGNVSKADLRRVPDAVLVVGTSLKIPGVRRIVKEMCQLTRSRRDGVTAWINVDAEPQGAEFKDCWDLVIRGKCDDIAELANIPHWDEQDIGDSWKVTGDPQQEERCKASVERDHIDIVIDAKGLPAVKDESPVKEETPELPDLRSKLVKQVQGIPTPRASPKMRTALPDGRIKTKQGKLLFGNASNFKEESDTQTTAKATKARKPRQPRKKKDEARPRNTVTKAFRATKNVTASGTDGKIIDLSPKNRKRSLPLEPDSSDLSSPSPDAAYEYDGEIFKSLPPLRDNSSSPLSHVDDDSNAEAYVTAPSTPPPTQGQFPASSWPPRETISPSSKPRAMRHLID